MNAIMDLTARAVSFNTTIQTTLLKGAIARETGDDKYSILNIRSSENGIFKDTLRNDFNNLINKNNNFLSDNH